MKSLFILLFFLLLSSCGKDDEQKYEDAVITANNLLSIGNCQEAIDVLEAVGRDSTRVLYTKTLASAYACRAGYSTTNLFSNDLASIDATNLLGSFTKFTTSSEMDAFDSLDFLDLQVAIDLLLYVGGLSIENNPTSAKRIQRIGTSKAADVNAFLMYLLMAQLGKYNYYYGSPDVNGTKAAGDAAQECLANYTDDPDGKGVANAFLTASGASCSSTALTDGHPSLGAEGSLNVSRMCQGVILFNNFFDVFPAVIASASGADFSKLKLINQNNLKNAFKLLTDTFPVASEAVSATSQTVCEQAYASSDLGLQYYFIYVLELFFQ